MKQIQDSSTVSTRPAVTASGAVGWFRHANVLTKVKATKVTVDWLNDLQGSFIDLFTRTSITPTGGPSGDRNLYDAIMALVSPKIDQSTGDARYVQQAGDTMTGLLTLSADPATNMNAATKQYADTKYAKTGGTLTGDVTVDKASGSAALILSAIAGVGKYLWFKTAGVNRWLVQANNVAESGGNAGSNFAITPYDDAGNSLGSALQINRATKAVTISGGVTLDNAGETITLSKAPTSAMHAANKDYVDGSVLNSANGYVILPNGLVMQWGLLSYTGGAGSIAFPMNFPSAAYNIQLTRSDWVLTTGELQVLSLAINNCAVLVCYRSLITGIKI
jgi:hypothetical protein